MELVQMPIFHKCKEYVGSIGFHKEDKKSFCSSWNGCYFVYFLMLNEEVVYIGRTSDLYSRVCAHNSTKEFDKIVASEFTTKAAMKRIEVDLINLHKPVFNKKKKS